MSAFAQSMIGVQWAYPKKRQSAYGTANPAADITETHPFEGADIIAHDPVMSDNAQQFGRGHEFATRLDIMSWNSAMKRTFTATTRILGHMLAFHLGSLTTTGLGGSPSAYQHDMEYQDPLGTGYYGSGRQLPVFSVVELVTSGYIRKFRDMQVKSVELTGKLNDWLMLTVECQGSGHKESLTGFTFPDMTTSEGDRLRLSQCVFTHEGADDSCALRSFRFRSEYQFFELDGYCPGSGYLTSADPGSGQIRNKLEFGRRAVVFEFVLRADDSETLFDRIEQRTEIDAALVFTGSTISGSNKHKLTVTIPKMRYRAVPISTDGDLIVYQVQGVVFMDATLGNPFSVQIVSNETGYLVASA